MVARESFVLFKRSMHVSDLFAANKGHFFDGSFLSSHIHPSIHYINDFVFGVVNNSPFIWWCRHAEPLLFASHADRPLVFTYLCVYTCTIHENNRFVEIIYSVLFVSPFFTTRQNEEKNHYTLFWMVWHFVACAISTCIIYFIRKLFLVVLFSRLFWAIVRSMYSKKPI